MEDLCFAVGLVQMLDNNNVVACLHFYPSQYQENGSLKSVYLAEVTPLAKNIADVIVVIEYLIIRAMSNAIICV